MHAVRTLTALSLTILASACAGPGTMNAMPASAGMAPMTMGTPGSMASMEPRMKTMREMHQKMVTATPAERQALMPEHMKAMQGGMDMMKEMQAKHGGMGGMGGMGAMGSQGGAAPMTGMAGMADGKGMPADMAQRHQMMTEHMAMMQLMMDMMADRMRPATASQ